jgi:hypothetical protein
MHTRIHTYTHTPIHAYTHTLIHAYTHTCIHAYTHTHIHTYTHTHIHTHIDIFLFPAYDSSMKETTGACTLNFFKTVIVSPTEMA